METTTLKEANGMDAGPWEIRFLGGSLFVLIFAMFALLLAIWPKAIAKDSNEIAGTWQRANDFLGADPTIRLIVLILIAGAIGSLIYGSTAFAVRVANRTFSRSWFWWYILRFPTGMGFALLLFLVIRGGLFAGSFANAEAAADVVNPFGFVALAALTGMFAEQASDKLKEIFEGIFRTAEKKGFAAAAPTIDAVPPVMVGTVGDALKVVLTGTNFAPDATAVVNDQRRDLQINDEKSAVLTLVPSDVAAEGQLTLRVINSENKGGTSSPAKIEVVAAPMPEITTPGAVKVGADGDQLKVAVSAKNVREGATSTVDKHDRKISALTDKGFVLELDKLDAAAPKELTVVVTNPPAVGGKSATFKISVNA